MWRRLLLACSLASGFVAAAAVTLVSALLAALTALAPSFGVAGAAALMALGLAACLSLPAVFIALGRARRIKQRAPASAPELLSRVWTKIKARPFLSSGLGGIGLLLVILNPKYLSPILRIYLREHNRAR